MKTLVPLRIETGWITLDRMDGLTEFDIQVEETFTTMEEARAEWKEWADMSKDEPELHWEDEDLFDFRVAGKDYRLCAQAYFEEREDDGSYWLDV